MTARESAYYTRTTRHTFDRGTGNRTTASNEYGRDPGARGERIKDHTHGFGNVSGNSMKVAIDIARSAKKIIESANDFKVVESFSQEGFSLGSDLIVDNVETTYLLSQLDKAFNQAVFSAAMGKMSPEEWANLKPGEQLLRLSLSYMSAGPSPSQMAREKAEQGNQSGEAELRKVPTIRLKDWQIYAH